MKARFFRWVAVTLAVGGALAAYPMARWASPDVVWAVIVGAGLSTANVVAGYVALEYAFQRSYTTFLKVVIGGMGLRLMVLLGALLCCILVLHMHVLALTVSLLGFYTLHLVVEVMFIQRTFDAMKVP